MNNLSGNSERARHFGEALPELKRIPRCGLDVVVDWLTDTLPKQRVGNCRVNNPSQRASPPSDASSEPLASEQSLRSSGRANGPPPSPAMASPVPASRHSLFHHRSRSTSRKRHPHRSLIARFASARVQLVQQCVSCWVRLSVDTILLACGKKRCPTIHHNPV